MIRFSWRPSLFGWFYGWYLVVPFRRHDGTKADALVQVANLPAMLWRRLTIGSWFAWRVTDPHTRELFLCP